MKRVLSVFVAILIIGFYSCENSTMEDDLQDAASLSSSESELKSQSINGNNGHGMLNYRAHLSGDNEVLANTSRATGQLILNVSKDSSSISYKLIVANIENVIQAHIHVAPTGTNGGVVVWLYPSAPPAMLIPGVSNGILNEGVFTASNLTGMLAEHDLADLLELMNNGQTYVNVHTSQFPPGEIRGQIARGMANN